MSSTVSGTTAPAPLQLVLCDAGTTANEAGVLHAKWTDITPAPGVHSIPALAEKWAIKIRSEYLSWLNSLAQREIGGRSLEDRLRLSDYDLSFWSMSLIAEKAPMNSAGIHTIFKLRALELLYTEFACVGLEYIGNDRRLAGLLQAWMLVLKHPFHFTQTNAQPTKPIRLPRIVKAFGYLTRKLWQEVRLCKKAPILMVGEKAGHLPLHIFTHFPNLDLAAARQGRFYSRYWEGLHDVIAATERPVIWIWIFSKTKAVSYAQAISYAHQFNLGNSNNRHVLLEQFVSPSTVFRAIYRYLRLLVIGLRIRPPAEAFRLHGSNIGFFPILESDWHDSLIGSRAMANAWHSSLYESISTRLPKAAATLYCWENQPWELALLTSLRQQGHSPILGHQHALPAPLNLRYIPLTKTPLPDRLIVGGSGPRRTILEGGITPDCIVECEAVRYQYLAKPPAPAARNGNFLVITSLLADETQLQLSLLAETFRRGGLRQFKQITIKPHPFFAVETILDQLGVRQEFTITSIPLDELWASTAVAFVANSTSASIDALYAGVPFAVCSPGDAMNLNPLFMARQITTVSTPEEIAQWLKTAAPTVFNPDYLILDPTLPRWRSLLANLTHENRNI